MTLHERCERGLIPSLGVAFEQAAVALVAGSVAADSVTNVPDNRSKWRIDHDTETSNPDRLHHIVS
jgi:hypothetical protein